MNPREYYHLKTAQITEAGAQRGDGMNQIRIEKTKIYLGKWLVGHLCRTAITNRYLFAADVDYCSPLDANNLRDLAEKLDAMNGVKA